MPWAAVAAVAAGVGAATSAAGAISSGMSQSAASKYQAQVAANNAVVANQNANLANQEAGAQAQSAYRMGAQKLGAQRAAFGANGGTLNSGSAEQVQQSTAEQTQLQVNNDTYQGLLQAYGYQTQATNFQASSAMDTAQANNAIPAATLSAGGSLLGGASQFATKWDQYQNPNRYTPPYV